MVPGPPPTRLHGSLTACISYVLEIEPAAIASPDAGARAQFTIDVDDVDAMCEVLKQRGVELLNGPMDRPWGIRTASFRDPAGHIWEIAK